MEVCADKNNDSVFYFLYCFHSTLVHFVNMYYMKIMALTGTMSMAFQVSLDKVPKPDHGQQWGNTNLEHTHTHTHTTHYRLWSVWKTSIVCLDAVASYASGNNTNQNDLLVKKASDNVCLPNKVFFHKQPMYKVSRYTHEPNRCLGKRYESLSNALLVTVY